MNRWYQWPNLIKIQECIWLIGLALYVLGLITGGMFTAYFATMAFLIVGLVTAIIAVIKKQYVLGIINLIVPIVCFAIYITIA